MSRSECNHDARRQKANAATGRNRGLEYAGSAWLFTGFGSETFHICSRLGSFILCLFLLLPTLLHYELADTEKHSANSG